MSVAEPARARAPVNLTVGPPTFQAVTALARAVSGSSGSFGRSPTDEAPTAARARDGAARGIEVAAVAAPSTVRTRRLLQ